MAGLHVHFGEADRSRLDAVAEFLQFGDEATLRISDGPFHCDWESHEGAEEHIRFAGQRSDVLALMQRCWLLLAPILQEETFGNVALEAKWNGLPVVTTDRGGLPELVSHQESGFLCGDGTVDEVIAGVRWFLEDPARHESAHKASLAFVRKPDGQRDLVDAFRRSWLEESRPVASDPSREDGIS